MAFEVNSVPLSLTIMRGHPLSSKMRSSSRTTRRPVRGVHHQVQTLSGEVIDQGEDAEASATHQRVCHEVERPAQIATLRDRHRRPRAECPFAATALAYAQPFLLVEPIELRAIEFDALPFEHQSETPIAKPPALRGQLPQSNAKFFIARPL